MMWAGLRFDADALPGRPAERELESFWRSTPTTGPQYGTCRKQNRLLAQARGGVDLMLCDVAPPRGCDSLGEIAMKRLLTAVIVVATAIGQGHAQVSYVEDFEDQVYLDPDFTTAVWNIAERRVRLEHFRPSTASRHTLLPGQAVWSHAVDGALCATIVVGEGGGKLHLLDTNSLTHITPLGSAQLGSDARHVVMTGVYNSR